MSLGDQYPGQPRGHGHGGAVPPSSGGVYGAPRRQEPGEPAYPSGPHAQDPYGPPGGYGPQQPGPSQPAHGQPPHGPPPHAQPTHGQPAHGQPSPGQPAHGQHPPSGGVYGQPARPPDQPPQGQHQPAHGQHLPAHGQQPPPAPGFDGGHFAEPPGFGPPPAPPSGGSRFWLTALAVLATLVVLAVCSVGGYFVFRDDGVPAASESPNASADASKSASPSASPSPTASPIDISSRSTDPEPLTEKELFGDKEIAIEDENNGKTRSYKVVKKQTIKDCAKGVTGDLKSVVKKLDCNQVVRAAINSKDGKYGATAGVFNLKDKGHSKKIDPLIKGDKGSFTGLAGPGASAQINKASLVLYWEERGHYMAYIMICRGDGRTINEDQNVKTIATDLLISHVATKLAERTGTVN